MANAMQVWESLAQEALAFGGQMIDRLPKLVDLYNANGLEVLINTTPDGQPVPGGGMTKERILELAGVFESFQAWLNTPVVEGGPTPLLVVRRVD